MAMIILSMIAGLAIGVSLARDSEQVKPVPGGWAARAMHYLACAALASLPAALVMTLLTALFGGTPVFAEYAAYSLGALTSAVIALGLMVALGRAAHDV